MHIEIRHHSTVTPIFPDRVSEYGFGKKFTDLLFTQKYLNDNGWHGATIALTNTLFPWMHPGTAIYHYGQAIFEGQKAYRTKSNIIQLFRPEENAARFNKSAERMAMPEIPISDQVLAITSLVQLQKKWVPSVPHTSLYIRPAMIATDAELGVHPSDEYLYFVLLSLAGSYFSNDFEPISIKVETEMKRAALGGTGEAKTSGNYAASMLAGRRARKEGFSQVLWLDSTNTTVEEVGAMNIFFVYHGKTLITPALNGSILHGITRKSILELAPHLNFDAEEKTLPIEMIIKDIQSGDITEAFGSGTAAVVAPISAFGYKGETHVVGNGKSGPVSTEIRQVLTDIQYGNIPDTFGWTLPVTEM